MDESATSESLLEELRALRAAVDEVRASLGLRRRVVLEIQREGVLLGQPVTVLARVTRMSDGEPVVNAPLVLTATWGKFRTEGYQVLEANTLTLRTRLDGTARVVLVPPTSEDLTAGQEGVLEARLRAIRPDVETPAEVEEDLRELARQYRWEPNEALRQAADIYFRDFHEAEAERVNYHDDLASWPTVQTAVMAFVGDERPGGEDASAVLGSAVLPLEFRNWVAPWVEAFVRMARAERPLRRELHVMARHGKKADRVAEHVYGRVHRFVREQRGRVGAYVARRVAEEEIREFIGSGIRELPLEERRALVPSLQIATQAVGRGELGALSGLRQARRDLRKEADSRLQVAEKLTGLEKNVGRLAAFDPDRVKKEVTQAVEVRLGETAGVLRGEIASAVKGKLDAGALPGVRRQLAEELRVEVDQKLKAKPDATAIEEAKQELASLVDTRLGQTAAQLRGEVDATLQGKLVDAGTLTDLRSQVATLQTTVAQKADAAVVSQLTSLNQGLAALRNQVSGVARQVQAKADRVEMNQALATKASVTEVKALEGNLTTLQKTSVTNTGTVSNLGTVTLRPGTFPTR